MPKKFNNLFQQIITEENIDNAFKKTQMGPMKYKRGSLNYCQNLTANLESLRTRLLLGNYKPQEYHYFKVYEPKERIIYAPAFEDKIVQHAVNNILKDLYKPCFIFDSYSCIEGKGTLACVERISSFMRKANRKYNNCYIIKADISKFFYSINRNILKKIIRKKIKCKSTLKLLDNIIDSSPNELGLPLGNLTSQLFANIYLNQLDQYCKRILGLKYYIRYADDIVVIVDGVDNAREVKRNIEKFLKDELGLEVHPRKSKIFPMSQGVNSVGFKIYLNHRLLRDRCKKKIKSKLKKMPKLINQGKLTVEKATQMLNSWWGHAQNSNNFNFLNYLLNRYDYLIFHKYLLKIDKIKTESVEERLNYFFNILIEQEYV